MLHLPFVLLFLLHVRLARCHNFPEYLWVRYGNQTLPSYRGLGTSLKKQRKAELDSEFLLYCQINNVIPNFIKFKLYRESLHHSVLYKDTTAKLLEMEILYKERLSKKHKQTTETLFRSLCNLLSFLDCFLLKHFVNKSINAYVLQVKNVHQRKFYKLGITVPNFVDPKKVLLTTVTTICQRERSLF